ncbi:MAG: hypothetical protein WC462_01280 [archaeon]
MDKKNPFSEASKERRRLLNQRNSVATSKKKLSREEKRNRVKDQRVDLSAKDSISPKGLYV